MRKGSVLTRYRIIVLGVKPRRFHVPDDEFITTIMEGDTFYGYSYAHHREGKFFDLWFTQTKEQDSQNMLTFGRIHSITPAAQFVGVLSDAKLYTTKMGQFIVEDVGLATRDEQFHGDDDEIQFS